MSNEIALKLVKLLLIGMVVNSMVSWLVYLQFGTPITVQSIIRGGMCFFVGVAVSQGFMRK